MLCPHGKPWTAQGTVAHPSPVCSKLDSLGYRWGPTSSHLPPGTCHSTQHILPHHVPPAASVCPPSSASTYSPHGLPLSFLCRAPWRSSSSFLVSLFPRQVPDPPLDLAVGEPLTPWSLGFSFHPPSVRWRASALRLDPSLGHDGSLMGVCICSLQSSALKVNRAWTAKTYGNLLSPRSGGQESRSRCGQRWFLLEAQRENVLCASHCWWLSPGLGTPWRHTRPPSSRGLLPVSPNIPPLMMTPVLGLNSPLTSAVQYDVTLTW